MYKHSYIGHTCQAIQISRANLSCEAVKNLDEGNHSSICDCFKVALLAYVRW